MSGSAPPGLQQHDGLWSPPRPLAFSPIASPGPARLLAGMTSRCRLAWLLLLLCVASPLARAAENPDETAVKDVIERFLTELGNANLEAVAPLFVPKASIAYAQLRDGHWTAASTSFEEWHASLQAGAAGPKFREPVDRWSVQIEDGQLAFVRAETHIEREGRSTSHNIDCFILLKLDGVWKIAHGSYTSKPAVAP